MQKKVARIDYLYRSNSGAGEVGESISYTDAEEFMRDVKEQNTYGVPMVLVLYADAKGETVPQDFILDMDPPPQGVKISYENVPVYYESADFAREHDQLDAYRVSLRANKLCKKGIEEAVAANYGGNVIGSGAYKQVVDLFGFERTMCILANTIRIHDWDARISSDNKKWAADIRIPDNKNMQYAVLSTHPGLVNIFTNTVRRRYQLTQPLTEADIKAEAERIMADFRKAVEPNSPDGTRFMAKLSDDFTARAKAPHICRLGRYIPFHSIAISSVMENNSRYASISTDEDRTKPLRTVKPPDKKKGMDR